MPQLVVVTGHEEIDRRLAMLSPRLQKKIVRQSLRKAGKLVDSNFKEIVESEAYASGAYMRSTKIRALKRSRGRIGTEFHVDREKYFQEYESEYGHKPHPAHDQSDPFYVPAVIEFGSETQAPIRPQRRALYDNEAQILTFIKDDLLELTKTLQ